MKRWQFATAWNLAIFLTYYGAATARPYALSSLSQSKVLEKPSDTLPRTIHHQLQVLPFYSVFDFIEFRIEGSRVTLIGQVLRPTLKAHAEAAVKDIEGVITVSNQIDVLPASASDDELRRAIYRVLFEDEQLKRYAVETVPPIHIIVKDGNIVLEGSVQSDSDRKLAGTRSGEVANSKSLQNHLVVKSR